MAAINHYQNVKVQQLINCRSKHLLLTTNTNTHKDETQNHRNAVKELTDTLVLLSVLFLFPTPLHICKHEINLQ